MAGLTWHGLGAVGSAAPVSLHPFPTPERSCQAIVLPPDLVPRAYLDAVARRPRIKQVSPSCPETADIAKMCICSCVPDFVFKWNQRGLTFLFPFALMLSGYNAAQLTVSSSSWQHLWGSLQPASVQLWVSFDRKPMRAAQFVTRHPINVSGAPWGREEVSLFPCRGQRRGAVGTACRVGV